MLIATYLEAAERAHADLTAWDQAAGDGDFGDNLRDGLRAAAARIPQGAGLGAELAAAAEWFLDHVGGTSGPLFGLLFDAMARRVRASGGPGGAMAGAPTAGAPTAGAPSAGTLSEGDLIDGALVDGLADGAAAIQRVGEAVVGDRTMVDALAPAVEFLRSGAGPVGAAPDHASALDASPDAAGKVDWVAAARVALERARATAGIRARMGRASYVGDRAIGTPDAGAMGVALLFWALAVTRVPGSEPDLTAPDALG